MGQVPTDRSIPSRSFSGNFCLWAVAVSAACCLPRPAVAEAQAHEGLADERSADLDTAAPIDDPVERAVVLFEESEQLFNAGEFAEAAALLRRAYELHPEPTLLYNLGRSLDGLGDLVGAIDAYQQYVEAAPAAANRGAVDARLATLRRQVGERDSMAPDGGDSATGDGAPADGVGPWPWVIGAAGLVVVGVGTTFGLLSRGSADDAAPEPVMVTAVSLHEDARTYATVANVAFVAGGLLAAGGLTWLLLSIDGAGEGGERSLSLGLEPASLALRGRF